jgi:hypothetical protein
MQLLAKVDEARTALSHRRIERRARKQLSTELAAFTTEAERNELDLILARHSDAETREIRRILSRQAAERQFTA